VLDNLERGNGEAVTSLSASGVTVIRRWFGTMVRRMAGAHRLAILSTHPIQYDSGWFRGLAAHPDLRVHVYYCRQATPQEQARAGFGVEFEWDVPLLTGYPHSFLQNVANPRGNDRFGGFDTPEIKSIIRRGEYVAVLINGWHYKRA